MAVLRFHDAAVAAIRDEMAEDPRVIVLGEDISHKLAALVAAFGTERIRDCPISESAMVGMAAGAAMRGFRVVVEIPFADITAVCFNSIVQTAAKGHFLANGRLRFPVVVLSSIARFRGHGPQGNQVAASWFYNVPDLGIAMPSSPRECYWSLRHALQQPVPTLFLEDRTLLARSEEVGGGGWEACRETRSGSRITAIGAGRAAALAEEAADRLRAATGQAMMQVLSLPTIKPLPREAILAAVASTGRALIVQDEPPLGGYGPAVRCLLDEIVPDGLPASRVRLLTGADSFMPYAGEEPYVPSVDSVTAAARELLGIDGRDGR